MNILIIPGEQKIKYKKNEIIIIFIKVLRGFLNERYNDNLTTSKILISYLEIIGRAYEHMHMEKIKIILSGMIINKKLPFEKHNFKSNIPTNNIIKKIIQNFNDNKAFFLYPFIKSLVVSTYLS